MINQVFKNQDFKKYYTTPFLLAVLLHVVVIMVILFSLDFSVKSALTPQARPMQDNHTQDNPIINAVSVNQTQINQEISRLQTQQQQHAQQQRAQQQKLSQQKVELQKQQERATRALAALQAEQQTLTKQKQQQKAQAEQLQQQQASIQAKQRQQEVQRKVAAEQQALEARKVLDATKAREATKARQVNALVSQYNSLILNAIYPHWIVTDKQKAFSTDLLINLANDGTVLNVSVQKGSGSPAFDASAVAAVYKSSPLPVPKDPQAFSVFRQFKLTLKPENIKTM